MIRTKYKNTKNPIIKKNKWIGQYYAFWNTVYQIKSDYIVYGFIRNDDNRFVNLGHYANINKITSDYITIYTIFFNKKITFKIPVKQIRKIIEK